MKKLYILLLLLIPSLLFGGAENERTFPSFRAGDTSNYTKIDEGGVISYAGTAKRKLTMRPAVNMGLIGVKSKPVQVEVGAYQCFQMPIWDSGTNVDQELFYRERIPYRWDGASNINFKMLVALNSAETVGKKFKFQFSWNKTSVTDQISAAVVDASSEVTITTDHNAQYKTYSVPFTVVYTDASSNIAARDMIAGRVRRVANSGGAGTEIAGDILICDWVSEYQIDKLYGVW